METISRRPFVEFMAGDARSDVARARGRGRSLRNLARSLLGDLLGKLHEAASGDLKDYDHLHQVRIAGKRLRYAMEVFADCFGAAAARAALSDGRGDAGDPWPGQRQPRRRPAVDRSCAAGSEAGNAQWDRLKPGMEGLLRFHQRRLPQERRRFLKWWEQWCAADVEAVLSEPTPTPVD